MAITNEDVISWLNKQSIWVKDAVASYYDKGSFDDADIKRFADECYNEAIGLKSNISISDLNLLSRDDREEFSIKSIGNIEGVNALISDKKLEFGNSGITVIYGENGAGKSGYIRIIKKLADAKYKEELKQNVYKRGLGSQTCTVSIKKDEEEFELKCDLKQNGEYAVFKNIDIFDTQISTAYIEAANEASYEPWIFSLFKAVADVSTQVKNELEQRKKAFDSYEIDIPEELRITDIGKKLNEITGKTTFEEDFFKWNKRDENLLSEKEKDANTESIKGIVTLLKKEIEQIKVIQEYLGQFVVFFSAASIASIDEARNNLSIALEEQKNSELLFSQDASELDKGSVSNTAWKNLWKDAKSYYDDFLRKKGIKKYTEINGICPLCGQEILDEKHAHRMMSVEEYINGNISRKVTRAKNELLQLLNKCPVTWDRKQFELSLESSGMDEIKDELKACAEEISVVSDRIHSDDTLSTQVSVIDVESIINKLQKTLTDKKILKQTNEDLLLAGDHKKLMEEINELKARKYVSKHNETVKNRIDYLKKMDIYDAAIKHANTNKITTMNKALAEELLTDDYVKRFNDELKILTKGTIKATLKQQKASKGKVPFKVTLEGTNDDKTNPSEILSEGEKRVVSLAAFFAESSGKNISCPLIVDDPISSLDLKYESRVIDRLVKAAEHRQVIVFTHRLSMVVGLFDRCGKVKIPYSECELLGRGINKGVPVESTHNGSKSLGQLKKLKNENIARLKKMDENSGEYIQGIHYLCQQIRIYVEKSVEDTLINGVVQRYRKDVQTYNRISWLSQITDDDCKLIDEMMTKYSYYDHSMSDEMPLQEYPLSEIETDLDKLIVWLGDITKRQNTKK